MLTWRHWAHVKRVAGRSFHLLVCLVMYRPTKVQSVCLVEKYEMCRFHNHVRYSLLVFLTALMLTHKQFSMTFLLSFHWDLREWERFWWPSNGLEGNLCICVFFCRSLGCWMSICDDIIIQSLKKVKNEKIVISFISASQWRGNQVQEKCQQGRSLG